MNRKIFLIILFAGAICFSSCQKDIDIFVPDAVQPNGPATWAAVITDSMQVNLLKKSLLLEPGVDSIEILPNAPSVFTGSVSKLRCSFPASCFVGTAGTVVTGKIYVETMLIKKKGDMIRMGKPTTSNDQMLISGGEFFIRAFQGNQELKIGQSFKIGVNVPDTPAVQQMKLFFGDETVPDKFNWLQFDSSAGRVLSVNSAGYEINSSRLHWLNCDYFYSFNANTQVKVTDSLPENYTNANTISYLVFDQLRSVVRLNPDINLKKFISGNLAPGLQATVIVISKQANDYYLGKETITTGAQSVSGMQNVKITPVKKTLAEIKAYLATL